MIECCQEKVVKSFSKEQEKQAVYSAHARNNLPGYVFQLIGLIFKPGEELIGFSVGDDDRHLLYIISEH